MKKSRSFWLRLSYVILSIPVGFLGSIIISSYFIPKDAGLAAGGIAVFWGLIGLVTALSITLFTVRNISLSLLKKINIGLLAFCLFIAVWIVFKVYTNQ